MKIRPEDYQRLRALIEPHMRDGDRAEYHARGLSPRRYRWDLLWASTRGLTIVDELYEYLNDDHIDTALRRIVGQEVAR